MTVEIELKAGLDDYEPVKKRLSALGNYCRSYKKSDTYWFPARTDASEKTVLPSGLRIRRECGTDADGTAIETVLVTFKEKKISGGIEVSSEHEFTVSNASLFEELLSRLGLNPDIRKEKQGWAWTIPPEASGQPSILAELSLVANLGWFLELEILAADDHAQTVTESRKRLLSLLEKLEIPPECIESRSYSEMLHMGRAPANYNVVDRGQTVSVENF